MSDDQWNTQLTPAKRSCPTCGLEVSTTVARCPRDGTDLSIRVQEASRITTSNPLAEEPFFAGRYEFLGVIGSGGMGVIYKARHLVLKKMVAIKMVHAHLINDEAFGRFQVEARAAALLNHPYIITVHDTGIADTDQPFMIMDFVEGKTLTQVLQRDGKLAPTRFLRLFIQVCEALSHAHKRNVLHRDIKPSNIMIVRPDTGTEEIRLMDFGIAKLLSESETSAQNLTKTGEAVGSPIYMSPEQARGIKTDTRTDLYSLGCVMYETIVGAPPFMGKTQLDTMLMHLNEDPRPISETHPATTKVDAFIERVIMKLLEKNPADRYQTADELLEDLMAIQAGKAPPNCRTGTRLVPAIKQQNKVLVVGLIGAGILALGLGGYVMFSMIATPPPKTAGSSKPRPVLTTTTTSSGAARQTIESWVKERKPFIDARNLEKLDDEDLEPLADPKAAEFVRQLELPNGNLSDHGLESISGLKQVAYLNLDGNWVSDLHGLKDMADLRVLSLRHTHIDPTGMSVIGRFRNLELLSLAYTAIRDQDLEKLYNLKQLRTVELYKCPNITQAAVVQLQKQLPNCFVAFDRPASLKDTDDLEYALVTGLPRSMILKTKFPKTAAEIPEFKSRMDQVANELRAGLRLLKDEPDTKPGAMALCYQTLGNCLNKTSLDEAKQYYLEGLALLEKNSPENPSIPLVYSEIAEINERKNTKKGVDFENRKKADDFWRQAVPLNEGAYRPYLRNIVSNRESLAGYYGSKKMWDEANRAYNSAAATLDEYHLGNSNMAAPIYSRLGDIAFQQKDYDEAIKQYLRASQIFMEQPDESQAEELKTNRWCIVYSYLGARKFDECQQYARSIMNLFDPESQKVLRQIIDKCTKEKLKRHR